MSIASVKPSIYFSWITLRPVPWGGSGTYTGSLSPLIHNFNPHLLCQKWNRLLLLDKCFLTLSLLEMTCKVRTVVSIHTTIISITVWNWLFNIQVFHWSFHCLSLRLFLTIPFHCTFHDFIHPFLPIQYHPWPSHPLLFIIKVSASCLLIISRRVLDFSKRVRLDQI